MNINSKSSKDAKFGQCLYLGVRPPLLRTELVRRTEWKSSLKLLKFMNVWECIGAVQKSSNIVSNGHKNVVFQVIKR